MIQSTANGNDHAGLREAIEELCSGKVTPKSLGRRLRHLKKRVVDGKCIDEVCRKDNALRWGVQAVKA